MGALLVAGGFSCIFTPLLTFMETGYFIVIMTAVFGIIGLIKSIRERRFGINFVFSVLSVLMDIIMILFPEPLLFAQSVMLIITAAWFVLLGVIIIINALSVTKRTGTKMWIFQLIYGIITVLIGGYSFFHPVLMAVSLGVLIGIFFIETGFALMFIGAASKD